MAASDRDSVWEFALQNPLSTDIFDETEMLTRLLNAEKESHQKTQQALDAAQVQIAQQRAQFELALRAQEEKMKAEQAQQHEAMQLQQDASRFREHQYQVSLTNEQMMHQQAQQEINNLRVLVGEYQLQQQIAFSSAGFVLQQSYGAKFSQLESDFKNEHAQHLQSQHQVTELTGRLRSAEEKLKQQEEKLASEMSTTERLRLRLSQAGESIQSSQSSSSSHNGESKSPSATAEKGNSDDLVELILALRKCSSKQLQEHVKYFDDKNLTNHPKLNEYLQKFKSSQAKGFHKKDHHPDYQLRVYFQNYLLKQLAQVQSAWDLVDIIKASDALLVGNKGKAANKGQAATHPAVELVRKMPNLSDELRELIRSYSTLKKSLQRLRARRKIVLMFVEDAISVLAQQQQLSADQVQESGASNSSSSSDEPPLKRQRLEGSGDEAFKSRSTRTPRLFSGVPQKLKGYTGHEETLELVHKRKQPG